MEERGRRLGVEDGVERENTDRLRGSTIFPHLTLQIQRVHDASFLGPEVD